MYKYKLIFEKTYTNRCMSKNYEQNVFFESDLELNQTDEIREAGYQKLLQENHQFIMTNIDLKPKLKEIILLNDSHE